MKNYVLDKRDLCAALRKAITRQGAVKVETLHSHVGCMMKGQVQVCVNTHLPCIFTGENEGGSWGPILTTRCTKCYVFGVLQKLQAYFHPK